MRTRAILFTALTGLLIACAPVSYSQFQSENRAQVGLERKLEAERQAIALATNKTTPVEQRDEIQQILTLESARRGLAEDARTDFRAATTAWFNATAEDQIVTLSRAGRKAWYAGGAVDKQLTFDIRNAGVALCGKEDGKVAAQVPRDCELIRYYPLLTALQTSWDTILDINLEATLRQRLDGQGLTTDEAATLIKAVVDMNQTSAEVAGTTTRRSDVRAWLTREQVLYYCSFSQALLLLGQDTSPKGARDAANHAQIAGMTDTPELQVVLDLAGIDQNQISGIYRAYSNRVKRLPGAGGLNIGKGFAPDRDLCRKLR